MKLLITVEGKQYDVDVQVLDDSGAPPAGVTPAAGAPAAAAGASFDLQAPIAGSVLNVLVAVGDTVSAGDTVVVLEAMKMESNIVAAESGAVKQILVSAGDAVTAGQVLVKF